MRDEGDTQSTGHRIHPSRQTEYGLYSAPPPSTETNHLQTPQTEVKRERRAMALLNGTPRPRGAQTPWPQLPWSQTEGPEHREIPSLRHSKDLTPNFRPDPRPRSKEAQYGK